MSCAYVYAGDDSVVEIIGFAVVVVNLLLPASSAEVHDSSTAAAAAFNRLLAAITDTHSRPHPGRHTTDSDHTAPRTERDVMMVCGCPSCCSCPTYLPPTETRVLQQR